MDPSEKAVEFVTEWWQLTGDIFTTLSAVRRFKQTYPRDYLFSFCSRQEIAQRAAALQEICRYVEDITLGNEHPNG